MIILCFDYSKCLENGLSDGDHYIYSSIGRDSLLAFYFLGLLVYLINQVFHQRYCLIERRIFVSFEIHVQDVVQVCIVFHVYLPRA